MSLVLNRKDIICPYISIKFLTGLLAYLKPNSLFYKVDFYKLRMFTHPPPSFLIFRPCRRRSRTEDQKPSSLPLSCHQSWSQQAALTVRPSCSHSVASGLPSFPSSPIELQK